MMNDDDDDQVGRGRIPRPYGRVGTRRSRGTGTSDRPGRAEYRDPSIVYF